MRHRSIRLVSFACLTSTLALAQSPREVAQLPKDRAAGAETIREDDLRTWLTTLTSPEYGGRGTGQEGFKLAATFVREHFRSLGLAPYGDQPKDGTPREYWQRLQWSSAQPKEDATWLRIEKDGKVLATFRSGEGLAGRVNADLSAKGPLALVIVRDPANPGLADLDVKGKVLLVQVVANPTPAAVPTLVPTSAPASRASRPRRPGSGQAAAFAITRELRNSEPAALIFVDDAQYAAQKKLTGSSVASRGTGVNPAERGRGRQPTSFVTDKAHLTQALAACGLSLDKIAPDQVLVDLPGVRADLQISVVSTEAPAYNVVGVLEGSDPVLSKEFVVIGSHLDHLGRNGAEFHPGADDDGSGSVGVLAVARAFAQNPIKPKRSILFVTFCGEEMGLLGSQYFVEHPPIPLASIAAELQMDMIGRDEEQNREGNRGEKAEDNRNSLHLIGTKKMSMELHELCISHNDRFAGFDLEWDQEGMFSRSDHANFARQGVPIAFFFTGLHRDYHETTDTVEKINFAKLRRVATYVYDLGFEIASSEGRPRIDPALWENSRAGLRGAPAKPAAPMIEKK